MSLKELFLGKRPGLPSNVNQPTPVSQPRRDGEGRIIVPSSALTPEGYIDPRRVRPGTIGALGDDYVGQDGEAVRGIMWNKE
ncbi:MAG TPA: hypothetical protein VF189_05070 [Patescibacteria group bacterium]